MAKILTSSEGVSHLRTAQGNSQKSVTLCGLGLHKPEESEGELNCVDCADIALTAIHLSTKKERKEWKAMIKNSEA